MSLLPSPYSIRLQDLKLWQGNYDILMKSKSSDKTHSSDFDTIEGISALDSTRSSLSSSSAPKPIDWDGKAITPTKPFNELLEEKLAEDKPTPVRVKTKRPFLKKGTGLLRYRMSSRPARFTKTSAVQVSCEGKNKSTTEKHENYFNKPECSENGKELRLTPLKAPDVSIKPKATWMKYLEDDINSELVTSNAPEVQNTSKPSFNSPVLEGISEFTLKHFTPDSPRMSGDSHENSNLTKFKRDRILQNCHSIANTTDMELRLFEALEAKVESSSFSSTNSSIVRLLSSTPNKLKKGPNTSPTHLDNGILTQKLEEVNRKTDVLNDFLQNLRKISSEKHYAKKLTSNASFSEEDTNTENTSFYTDFENTFRDKVDIAINTSFKEDEGKDETPALEACQGCKDLSKRLNAISEQLPDIQAEKARVCDFAKELEKKRDHLTKEIDKLKTTYDQDVGHLRQELEEEKKKFAREKAMFDMYIKESQNRPSKKEREEIAHLKQQLVDVQELLKLKETKNGATQARLRNTLKQAEKEKTELKTAIEALQKENAKLVAAQKVRRPSESKMLQEINKNLTKLTMETMKQPKSKSKTSEHGVKSLAETQENVEKAAAVVVVKKQQSQTHEVDSSHEMTVFADLSIEKQYENVFKQESTLVVNHQNSSLNEVKKGNKTETVFSDGSREIKYTNGNSKTVSPDGKLIIVHYYNGDIKETNLTDNTLRYYYAESATWHTQFDDGSELLEYPSGQKERKHKDGKKEVFCPDGRSLTKMPDGAEEVIYPDGSKILKNANGEKILILPNGQKEIHTKEHKRREYPDGTVKIVYPDGTQETRYASGRLRIKDANGVLITDSHAS